MLNLIHHTKSGTFNHTIATIPGAIALAAHLGFMQALLDDPWGSDEKEWHEYERAIAELSKRSNIEKIELSEIHTIEFGG